MHLIEKCSELISLLEKTETYTEKKSVKNDQNLLQQKKQKSDKKEIKKKLIICY